MTKSKTPDTPEQRAAAAVHRMLHDFAAPLRHVEGFANLLVSQLQDQGNEELAEMAERVQLAGNLAQNLSQGLGALALKRLGTVKAVPLQPLLAALEQRWQGTLRVVVPTKLPVAEWPFDERLIVEALDAICDNTQEYAEGADLVIGVEADAQWLVLRLSNLGPTVLPGQMDRILTPFGRLGGRPDLTHPGLGLNQAMQVARLHGGGLHLQAPSEGGLAVELKFSAKPSGMASGIGLPLPV